MIPTSDPKRRSYPQTIRSVVITPSGGFQELEVYGGSYGGTNINGWNKVLYRPVFDPPAPPLDITAQLGNQTWELGVNLMLWGWHWEVNWYSGQVMSYEWPVTSTGTSTTSIIIRALDNTGAVLGTISTTTFAANDRLNTKYNPPPYTPTFNFALVDTITSGGSYTGPLNAIELERTWTGTVTTTRTTIGGPIFIDDIFYSSFGPAIVS